MAAGRLVLLALVACSPAVAVRDVPKGYCHDCEVTCFEDCVVKFDREIIQPDLTDKKRLSRKDTAVEAHMKKKLHGVVLSQNATDVPALKESYSSCLNAQQCPCPHDAKKASFLGAAAGKSKCAAGAPKCALGCVNKTLDAPALLQKSAVKPGPSDPDDAAIPWSINVHPVKINTFATGRQNLEQCFKSCLAATCGCEDAPGMQAIDDLNNAIKANDMAKDPVDDTKPSFQYKPAPIEECGKGMQGKKITKGLYLNTKGGPLGWTEICSDEFFESIGKAADVEKKNCDNSKALLAGCLWDDTKGACVYGLKKIMHCNSQYTDDEKL